MTETLCDRCKTIPVDLFIKHEYDYELHPSFQHLEQSAQVLDCRTCKIFLDCLVSNTYQESPRYLGKILLSHKMTRHQYNAPLRIWCSGEPILEFVPCFVWSEEGVIRRQQEWGFKGFLSPEADSSDNIMVMRGLIDNCLRVHSQCQDASQRKRRRYPRRLVAVDTHSTGPRIRLVDGRDIKRKKAAYLTLSHCWGKVAEDAPWKLTKSSAARFYTAIPFHILPLTFQQAISITLRLGEKYIWIDSLCIIQDSVLDWMEESQIMGQFLTRKTRKVLKNVGQDASFSQDSANMSLSIADVYAGSLCTLSSASESTDGGCFLPRREIINTVELQYDVKVSGGRTKWVKVAFHPNYAYFREEPPVYRRAWCLQERELSRRIIQFTTRDFIWDCKSMTITERTLYREFGNSTSAVSNINNHGRLSPGGRFNSWIQVSRTRLNNSLNQKPADRATMMDQHYDQWYYTMEVFSNGAIMVPKDRHAAIQALISQHVDKWADDCIHGLWTGDLERGLLWLVLREKDMVEQPPVPAIAPSWSWMHLNGPVSFRSAIEASRRVKHDNSRSEFLDGVVVSLLPWKRALGRYDPTYFPALRAQGRLVKLYCALSGIREGEYHLLEGGDDDSVECIDKSGIGMLSFDTQTYAVKFNCIFAFPMVVRGYYIEGLALVPMEMEAADRDMKYYRRIGFVSLLKRDIVDGLGTVKFMIL